MMYVKNRTRWNLIGICAAVAAFTTWTASAHAESFQVTRDGNPQAAIVIPSDALEVVEYAAEELQYHVRRASGADVPIVRENETDEVGDMGRLLYLGATNEAAEYGLTARPLTEGVDRAVLERVKDGTFFRNLGAVTPLADHELEPVELRANTFILKVTDDAMFIVGRDSAGDPLQNYTAAGTLFGVYDVLHEQMGVRWLWPGELGEHIPETPDITFTGGEAVVHEPELLFSQWRTGRSMDGWASEEAGEAFYEARARWLRRHRFGIGSGRARRETDLRTFHTFLNYWHEYGETKPEIFNMLPDGTRREHPGRGRGGPGITLCVSEPELWNTILENWRDSWRGRLGQHIPLGENDSPAVCACENCREWDAPDSRFETSAYWSGEHLGGATGDEYVSPFGIPDIRGNSTRWGWHEALEPSDAPSVSDRYARFYREVQRRAEEDEPHAMVTGFAYLNYWKAPQEFTDLNERVIISFVPPLRLPYTDEVSESFRENWDGWRATGARPYLRPNLRGGQNTPLFYGRRLAADVRYAAAEGMIGSDLDSGPLGQFGVQGPSLYALARSHTAAGMDADDILDEYFSAFGPAAEEVKAYFAHWEQVSDEAVDISEISDAVGDAVPHWFLLAYETFPEDVMERGGELLDDALDAAEGDSMARRRVGYLQAAFRDADLTLQAVRTSVEYERPDSQADELEQRFASVRDELLEHRAAIEADVISDFGRLHDWTDEELGVEEEAYNPRPDLPRIELTTVDENPELEVSEVVLDMRMPREGWRFRTAPEKEGYEQGWYRPEFDDSDWDEIEIELAWTSLGYSDYTGSAWYRRTVELPAEPGGHSPDDLDAVELFFRSVDEMAWVWVNGEFVGSHHELGPSGWNVPFALPVDEVVKWGEPNQISVLAKNTASAGGIFRPVRLRAMLVTPAQD